MLKDLELGQKVKVGYGFTDISGNKSVPGKVGTVRTVDCGRNISVDYESPISWVWVYREGLSDNTGCVEFANPNEDKIADIEARIVELQEKVRGLRDD